MTGSDHTKSWRQSARVEWARSIKPPTRAWNGPVAIKVLPAHFASDPDLKQRFEREAKTISGLNHPHICTLYDVGEADPPSPQPPNVAQGFSPADKIQFLVMEYLEGETMAERLRNGPLPLTQALRYGMETADALDKAHRQGVTHRDLKPGNIMITKAGAKLLDFGLAKLRPLTGPSASLSPGGGEGWGEGVSALPTMSASLTPQGSILGTLQYMAPEQLEGRDADARSDIFAFGAVLYEMVTGKKAFEGKSQASLITAIMSSEPAPVSSLQAMTPPALDYLVKTCLAKDPDDRWQTAGDVARQLQWVSASATGTQPTTAAPVSGVVPAAGRRGVSVTVAAGLATTVALVAGLTVWLVTRPGPPPPAPVQRLSIELSSTAPYLGAVSAATLALSPNGAHLAYVAEGEEGRQLYLRSLDQLETRPVPGTEGAYTPFFSPDGEWIAFFTASGTPQGQLKRVSIRGGPPLTLSDAFVPSGAWGRDDTIVFTHVTEEAPGWSLYQVQAAGGAAQRLTTPEEGENHGWPEILPGGRAVLYSVGAGPVTAPGIDAGRLEMLSLETGESRTLIEQGYGARYVPTGHLIYVLQGTLMAVSFDVDQLEVTGSPAPMLDGFQTLQSVGIVGLAVSPTGLLIYAPGTGSVIEGVIVRRSREGQEIETLVAQALEYPRYLRVSPDGEGVVLTTGTSYEGDLWVHHFDGRRV